ncbi:Short/branched chain specific acyl-coa dehydrogenase, partial [Globisporangium splendens]
MAFLLRKTASLPLTKVTTRRGLKTLSGPSRIGSTRSIQQAVRENQVEDWSPMPLTMLTEEESMFKDSVAKFAADVILPKVKVMDETGDMDPAIIRGLFENGLLSVEIPAEYGGTEASFMSLCLTIEELSKVDAGVGLLCDLQNTVVNNVFLFHANEEQRQKYLPRLTTDVVGSFCLTEAGSGSDAFALRTRADVSADGSYYTLNGQKMWISNVEYADVFLIFATVDPSLGYKGITCFIVDRDTEGLDFGPPEDKLGIRASSTCAVNLTNVKVRKENIIGEVGKGYAIAIGQLNEGRIGIASQMLGIAQGAYDHAMPYLFQRQQFGRDIGSFQAMQHQYADLATDIESARLLIYNAARLKDAGLPYVKQSCMAKLTASRVAEKTASKCIEMLGGVGFTKSLLAEKYFRDSKVGSIYGGTSNIQLSTIAKVIKQEFK